MKNYNLTKPEKASVHGALDGLLDFLDVLNDNHSHTVHASVVRPKEKKQLYFTIHVSEEPYMPRLA